VHVATADLRAVRDGDAMLRFAVLGPVAVVDAEVPSRANVPSSEEPCVRPHLGMVVQGRFTLEHDGTRRPVTSGSAFHVPDGAEHRHVLEEAVRILAFEPVGDLDTSEAALRRLGLVPTRITRATAPPLATKPVPERGRVEADLALLGDRLLTVARFGPRSGFATDFCDVPHWGTIITGSVTIEWEDDVEVLSAGDVFRCPPGPPGHRIMAAEPAVVVDLTPLSGITAAGRHIDWRRAGFAKALAEHQARGEQSLEVAQVL
jgi:quercetin dioxygenase-like cupin family protein